MTCHLTFQNFQAKAQEKKQKKAKAEKSGDGRKVGELKPPPEFLAERLALFERIKKDSDERLAAKPREPIKVREMSLFLLYTEGLTYAFL